MNILKAKELVWVDENEPDISFRKLTDQGLSYPSATGSNTFSPTGFKWWNLAHVFPHRGVCWAPCSTALKPMIVAPPTNVTP